MYDALLIYKMDGYNAIMPISCLPLGGGYVISPINRGKQSVVKHMLAIDWKFWKSYLFISSAKSITIRMLGRIAGEVAILEQ